MNSDASIPLLSSSYPGRVASRNATDSLSFLLNIFRLPSQDSLHSFRYIASGRTHRKHRFHRYPNITSIVACLFVAAGTCLPRSCLAMNVYSDFTIPAFGRHVTIASRPVLKPTQPHIQWEPWALSQGVKRPGSEADQSSASSAEIKNGGAMTPLPHTSL
jgi:hypothetical protein